MKWRTFVLLGNSLSHAYSVAQSLHVGNWVACRVACKKYQGEVAPSTYPDRIENISAVQQRS